MAEIDPRHIKASALVEEVTKAHQLAERLGLQWGSPDHAKMMDKSLNGLCRYLFENFSFTIEESSETDAAMVREYGANGPKIVDVTEPSNLNGMTDIRAVFTILNYTTSKSYHRLETEWEGRLWCKFWGISFE